MVMYASILEPDSVTSICLCLLQGRQHVDDNGCFRNADSSVAQGSVEL